MRAVLYRGMALQAAVKANWEDCRARMQMDDLLACLSRSQSGLRTEHALCFVQGGEHLPQHLLDVVHIAEGGGIDTRLCGAALQLLHDQAW